MAQTGKDYDIESNLLQSSEQADDSEEAKEGNSKPQKKRRKIPEGFEKNIIRDSDVARERGKNGGVRSGEVRREKRDARENIRYILSRMARSQNFKNNLTELGVERVAFSNMTVLNAKLFTMAMSGDLEAYITLMKMAGYDPEENRRERESVSSDARRDKEIEAKLEALGQKKEMSSMSFHLNDEDSNNDIVIYMPQTLTEEECQPEEEDLGEESKAT